MESALPLYVYVCVCVAVHTCRRWSGWSLGRLCSAKKKKEKEILRMSKQVLYVPECVYVG